MASTSAAHSIGVYVSRIYLYPVNIDTIASSPMFGVQQRNHLATRLDHQWWHLRFNDDMMKLWASLAIVTPSSTCITAVTISTSLFVFDINDSSDDDPIDCKEYSKAAIDYS